MKLIYRRIYFWTSVVIFFTLGPALILYTQGYRVLPKEHAVINTGTIVVSTRPVNAKILINNSETNFTTPSTIDSLEPGEYLVSFKRDGYKLWAKNIVVKEGQSTFLSDIRLIKDAPAKQSKASDSIYYDPSSRLGFITTLQTESGLVTTFYRQQILSNLIGAQQTIIPISETGKVNVVAWSPIANRAILETDNRYWLIDTSLASATNTEITSVIPANWKTMHWSTRNDEELIVTSSDSISVINLANITKRTIPAPDSDTPIAYSDAFVIGNAIHVIVDTSENSQLWTATTSGNWQFVSELNGNNLTLLAAASNILILKTGNEQMQVYHEMPDRYRAGYTFNGVKEAVLNATSDQILLTNGTELFTYDINTDALNLLVRQGSGIAKIDWFENSHATYVSNNKIHLIERDGRDTNIDWELAPSSTNSYFVNDDFDTLFFVDKSAGETFLFNQEI